jgi:rhamnose utilization protein RhaD (predicted bifunctional aldolase and dehydrogenase)
MSELKNLINVSRMYGNDSRYVLLGGGNTSMKYKDVMYVKASGSALSTITEHDFVKMSLSKLERIWSKTYSADCNEREEQVLSDMMLARYEGESARPSVEALLHALIPYIYVVHLHPALVNGLTCSVHGSNLCKDIFPDALWVPIMNPGYVLANDIRTRAQEFIKMGMGFPKIIFLQNHGIFIQSDTLKDVQDMYKYVMGLLDKQIVRKPDLSESDMNDSRFQLAAESMKEYFGKTTEYTMNTELALRIRDEESFEPISSAYTPDHIVYGGFKPLWISEHVFAGDTKNLISKACEDYEYMHMIQPKVVVIQNTGAFASSRKAMLLFMDTLKVAAYAEAFGGHKFMEKEYIDFIRTWEVEKYRSSQSK